MADAAKSLKVFVSYSRTDVEFADQLVLALEDRGFEAILDRHDMSGGENWRERLGKLILSADAVTFILTAKSASSEICAWEVEEAARLGKRILPVTYGSVAGVTPPKTLSDLNWIPFWADPAIPGAGFYYGVKRLMEALSVDLDWLRAQTRYSERAAEWIKSTRVEDLLLRGEALKEAHTWLGRTPPGSSPPDSVREYLAASSDAEQNREAAAKAQLEEREQAVKMAEAAVAEKQEAVAEKARIGKRLRLLATLALVVGVGLVGVALAGLWYAGLKAGEAGDRRAALFAQAGLELCREGDCDAGMLLAVAGDPAAKESIFETALRSDGYPVLRTALAQLYADDRLIYANKTLESVVALAPFPDGKRFITFHYDKSVRIWAADKSEPIKTFSLPQRVAQAIVLKDGERMLVNWSAYREPVTLWDLMGNVAIRKYGTESANAIAVDPAQKTALLGLDNGVVDIWPLNSDGAHQTVKTAASDDYGAYVRSLAFSEDGLSFAAGDDNGVVTLWPVSGGEPIASIKTKTREVKTLTFIPKAYINSETPLLLGGSGDGQLLQIEAKPDGESDTIPGFSSKTGEDAIGITDVAIDPERLLVLMQSAGARATLLRIGGTVGASSLLDDREETAGALMLPQANALVIVSVTGTVSVWKFEASDQRVQTIKATDSLIQVAASPDGSSVLSIGPDLNFAVWPAGETKPARSWVEPRTEGVSEYWRDIAFSADGRLALSPDGQNSIRIWNVADGSAVQTMQAQGGGDLSVAAFLPDGRVIGLQDASFKSASAGAAGYQLVTETWKVGSDKSETRVEGLSRNALIHAVAVHPDGQQMLVAGGAGVELWRLGENKPAAFFATGDTDAIAWHPDGQRFVAGLATGTVQLWQTGATEPDQVFVGHKDQVTSIKFNAAGDRFLTSANDATARLWQIGQRSHLQKFESFDTVMRRAWFDADGTHVWTASLRAISKWTINPIVNESAVEQARLVCERLDARGEAEIWPALRQRYPILDDKIADRPCEAMGLVKPKPKAKPMPAAPPAPVAGAGSAPD